MKLKSILKLCYPGQKIHLMVDDVGVDETRIVIHTTSVTISKELENRSFDKYMDCKVVAIAPMGGDENDTRAIQRIQLGAIK